MKSFEAFMEEEKIDYIVVVFDPENGKSPYLRNALLEEGRWIMSGRKDWMVRVDAEKPEMRVHRHAHIARAKHINAKNMQASWKDDATRHDRMTFNREVGARGVVQQIAREALGLDSSTILECLSQDEVLLVEAKDQVINQAPVAAHLLRLRY